MARKSWRERRGDGQALTRQPCHPARSARKAGRSRPHRRRRLRPQQAAGVDFWRGNARSPWSIVLLPIACPLRANRSLEPFEDPLIHAMVLSRIGALASFRRLERLTAFHPQLTSDQLPPHLAERLHSSDDEAAWNDRDGREAAVATRPRKAPLGHPETRRRLFNHLRKESAHSRHCSLAPEAGIAAFQHV